MSREVCGYCGLEVPCGCGVIQRNSVSAQSELDRLRKENAALREALQAFSIYVRDVQMSTDEMPRYSSARIEGLVQLARAALQEPKP